MLNLLDYRAQHLGFLVSFQVPKRKENDRDTVHILKRVVEGGSPTLPKIVDSFCELSPFQISMVVKP